jgi:putative FmdB family regulatory protein
MPIYEYECKECGKLFEVYQKVADAPVKQCECCSGRLHRLISQSTFHLKGTGWYATDYGKKPGGGDSPATGKAKKTAEAKKPAEEKGKTDSTAISG